VWPLLRGRNLKRISAHLNIFRGSYGIDESMVTDDPW
jgi:hypothetical protein